VAPSQCAYGLNDSVLSSRASGNGATHALLETVSDVTAKVSQPHMVATRSKSRLARVVRPTGPALHDTMLVSRVAGLPNNRAAMRESAGR
jgi:hypothetical protein